MSDKRFNGKKKLNFYENCVYLDEGLELNSVLRQKKNSQNFKFTFFVIQFKFESSKCPMRIHLQSILSNFAFFMIFNKVFSAVKNSVTEENITNFLELPFSNENGQENITKYITMTDISFKEMKNSVLKIKDEILLVFDIDSTLYSQIDEIEAKLQKELRNFPLFHIYESWDLVRIDLSRRIERGEIRGVDINVIPTASQYDLKWVYANVDRHIKPNKKLKEHLNGLPHRIICLTNNSAFGAKRILQQLDLEDCFECVYAVDHSVKSPKYHKPLKIVYSSIEECYGIKAGLNGAKNIIFFDNNLKNVRNASKAGWRAFLVDDVTYLPALIDSALNAV